ncbi:M48 family metallopeptidase [Neopusillimonas aromaticivorans]|uniref:M48 family metallopeptidase n=1 Tax=Neopusillimonas aromaticivorans TaxID=2979868 RepID=UPI002594C359|nr:M48 family metallopeptidase [Neopusillimonas aromaticivorans]WJJ93538.1 M48 family metallopeptidase [Neopusillimonas aromaticivorans]
MVTFSVRRWIALAGLSGTVVLAGCAAVQTTGSGAVGIERKQYMSSLVSEQQLQQEAASQYNTLISQARAQGALDVNAAQTRRVQAITQRLIAQVGVFRPDAARWNWQVHVLKSNDVNAWCMPGGKIAVYTGLIDQLQASDAELAAVIGHEIAHALREHTREQVSQKMAANVGLSVLAAVTGSQATADLGGTLTEVMFTLPNSRTHEIEADRMGVELAARAGYDPYAAVTLWEKMGRLGGGGQPEFLSTHPSASTRIADLKAIAAQMMPLYEQSRR